MFDKNVLQMEIVLLIIISSFLFNSCSSTNNSVKEYIKSPCKDVQYLRLKKMKISEMTGAESEYFKIKATECKDFESNAKSENSTSDLIIVLSILGGLAGLTAVIFIFKAH